MEPLDCGEPVGGALDRETGRLQVDAHQFADVGLVVDDKHGCHAVPPSPMRSGRAKCSAAGGTRRRCPRRRSRRRPPPQAHPAPSGLEQPPCRELVVGPPGPRGAARRHPWPGSPVRNAALARRHDIAENLGHLSGVSRCVVVLAVVEHHPGALGLAGEVLEGVAPLGELGRRVQVVEAIGGGLACARSTCRRCDRGSARSRDARSRP